MGSCCGASSPQPPDPIQTASAQTATNVSTAIANAFLGHVNQITPQGNLAYDQTGTFNFVDPTSGLNYGIPEFTSRQTLSQPEQTIFDQQEAAKGNIAGIANRQSQYIGNILGTQLDTSGAPAAANPSQLAGFNPQMSIGPSDFSADRANVEQALFQRVKPQIDLEQNRLEQRLSDQGIRPGSPAYTAAYDDFNRQVNDMRLNITAQAGQEQQRMFQEAQAQGTFANTAQAQAYQQAATRLNAANAARQQYLAELYQNRNLPINEVTALLSGSQVSQPNWVNAPQIQVPTTDVAGIINQNFNQQLQGQAIQSALLGNIIGAAGKLGSSTAFVQGLSDRRMKDDIHRIGTVFAADPEGTSHELPIHSYTYKSDPTDTPYVGPMAQDVERIDSRAVIHDRRGVKYIRKPHLMGAILRAA